MECELLNYHDLYNPLLIAYQVDSLRKIEGKFHDRSCGNRVSNNNGVGVEI